MITNSVFNCTVYYSHFNEAIFMQKSKDVYYVSGTTGILAKEMGKALLCQFPGVTFNEELFPFIRTVEQAEKVRGKILKQSGNSCPIIFSTLFTSDLNEAFNTPEVVFLNLCDQFIVRLEEVVDQKALRKPGTARALDDSIINVRTNAIHYSIEHDDGTATSDYDDADIIIVGVSRSGKTPISIFLATQMGLKTANYPLVDQDLEQCMLPREIQQNPGKIIGLVTRPMLLHSFREKRYPGSKYASLSTCERELKQSEQIFTKYKIPSVISAGRSIEETATEVAQTLKIKPHRHF